jgi:hypothetical protein
MRRPISARPFTLAALLLLVSTALAEEPPAEVTWEESVLAWRQGRAERLQQPDGWLSLAGLHWLEEGATTFGTGSDNDLVLPAGPERAGTLYIEGSAVRIDAVTPGLLTADGEPASSLVLATDAAQEGPTLLRLDRLSFFVIDRGGHLALRVRDPENPARAQFQGLEYFPPDPSWRFDARFEPYEPVKTIRIADITGLVEESPVWGAVVFEKDAKTYRLDALAEPGDVELFLIFGDRTNGIETYGAGRYLYTAAPDSEGRVELDFNKSYSPPCIFTPFATCPLPPPQNRLPLRVEAGEKTYGGGH